MRRTKKTLKRIRFVKTAIVIFAVLQFCIVMFFLFAWKHTSSIKLQGLEMKCTTIVIDNISYDYVLGGNGRLTLFSNHQEYHFATFPVLGTEEYSNVEMRDILKIGDQLTIEYFQKDDLNIILGASKDALQLRSIGGYEAYLQKNSFAMLAAFAFVQIIIWIVFILFLVYNRDLLKNRTGDGSLS